MKTVKTWLAGWILSGCLGIAAACGGKAAVDGTDSHTHWLKDCQVDGDCGALSCICGVCTKACDEGVDCASFGAETACEVPAGCTARGPTACVAKSPDGGSGGGGGGAGDGALGGGNGVAGSASSAAGCAAMDAHSSGELCLGSLGYAWDGTHCTSIPCRCQGNDCNALFATADACDHAHRSCYAEHAVSRDCVTHADCVVQSRYCCQSCAQVDDPGQVLIATAADSPSLLDAGICVNPQAICDDCVPHNYQSVYAACVEGECRLLDLSRQASCQTAADCRLVTKDCCDCGGDFSASGIVAVDDSFERPDYCPANQGCLACIGGPADGARALCTEGTCTVGLLPR